MGTRRSAIVFALLGACKAGDGGSGDTSTGESGTSPASATSAGTSTSGTSSASTTASSGAETSSSDGSGSSSGAETADSTTGTESTAATATSTDETGGVIDDCADHLFCEDFEDDTVEAEPGDPWMVTTDNGEVTVVDERAHGGTHAARVSTGAGEYKRAFFQLVGAPVFPLPAGVLYGRIMILMDAAPADGVHWTTIQGSGPLPGHDGVTAHYRYGGMNEHHLMGNYETWGLSTDCWLNSDSTVMPTGHWACFEWRFDQEDDEMDLWIDGTAIQDLAVRRFGQGCIGHDLGDEWLAPTFDTLSLGLESYQADEPREAWIDDIVLDDQRIGCPQ